MSTVVISTVAMTTDAKAMVAITTVAMGTVDIEEEWLRKNEWSLIPNPANSMVTLQWSGDLKASEVRLYDQMGRPVEVVSLSGLQSPQFSVAHLASGLYYVTLQTEGGATATRKLVVASAQ